MATQFLYRWCLSGVLVSILLYAGCSNDLPMSGIDPVTPRVPSIIPLARGNAWSYSWTDYDSSGTRGMSRAELNWEIPRVYGVTADTDLVEIHWDYDSSRYREFVYEYESERTRRGILLAYRDIDVSIPGIYVVGSYERDTRTLYDTAALWLAYPARPGMKWDIALPGTEKRVCTLVGTREKFHIPIRTYDTLSPVTMLECYLYKEMWGSTVRYRYFHPDFGEVGYVQYQDSVLRVTYILESVALEGPVDDGAYPNP